MTDVEQGQRGWWTRERVITAVVVGVLAVAAVVIALAVTSANQRADDRRVDEIYCTLEGVGPDDVGPNTGELCSDLLD